VLLSRTKTGVSYCGSLAFACRTLIRPVSDQARLPPNHTHAVPSPSLGRPASLSRCALRYAALVTTSHRNENRFPGSSHGVFSKIASPPTSQCVSRTHRNEAQGANLEHGPPVPFLTTTTVYSTHCFASLLHLAADHGVRTVSGLSPTLLPVAKPSHVRCPFRAFPSIQAESRHPDIAAWFTETRSPLAVSCTLQSEDRLVSRNLRGLTLMKSVALHQCCHLRLARCSHGLLRLRAFTHVRDFTLAATTAETIATRDASTTPNATAFPKHRLRDVTVTAGTSASFRTAVPHRSKLLLGSLTTEVMNAVACDRSPRHLAFTRPSSRPNPPRLFAATCLLRYRSRPESLVLVFPRTRLAHTRAQPKLR